MNRSNLIYFSLVIIILLMFAAKENFVAITNNVFEKRVFFREMVNYDMKLRAAVSNSAINNVFHTYRAFDAMKKFIGSTNPLYRNSIDIIKVNLKKRKLFKYINNIQKLASRASFLLKRKSKVSHQVWKKIDGYISMITMNCRNCHLQTK